MFQRIVRPFVLSVLSLFPAVALSIVVQSAVFAKESPAPTGSYTLITNNVYDRGDQTGLKAGTVSVRAYQSGALVFDSLTEENGWVAFVAKDGGTSSGDRVVVEFDHPELGGLVRFMIEPGKLDIR
ncbi:MAG: hypothetical protein R3C20_18530 [Planctomycetaceae bacterium]